MKERNEIVRSVSIIMPTYNEAGNIVDLIKETEREILNAGVKKIQIIVADDNSPDETWKIAANTSCEHAKLDILRRMQGRGLTNSLNDGIARSENEVIVWLDCDFSHPPKYIPQLLYMIGNGYDIVVNSRYVIGGDEDRAGKGGALQLFLSKTLNWGVRFILRPSFSDYTSGFVAVRREIFNEIKLRGDYGEYFVDFIFRAMRNKNIRICELPYTAMIRRSGESKTGSNLFDYMRRGRKYLWTATRLKFAAIFGVI